MRVKVCIIMGESKSGKTNFIQKHFPQYTHLTISEYQKRLKDEVGNPEKIEMGQYRRLLEKANEQIREDL